MAMSYRNTTMHQTLAESGEEVAEFIEIRTSV